MLTQFGLKHAFALKWLGIGFIIKLMLFVYFATNFNLYWPENLKDGLFNASNDSGLYYREAESFFNGLGYNTSCRMPGLLPVYCVVRLFFNVSNAKSVIIILQMLTEVFSVYLLALTAKKIFNSHKIFLITFFLYAISSFVSIWAHYGLSDSFSVSLLIFSVFFLIDYKDRGKLTLLFLSGFFISWSIFFRPVHGIIIPVVIVFFLLNRKKLALSIRLLSVYLAPTILFLSLWTYKNFSDYNRIIVLQGNTTECFQDLTADLLSIRELISAWGEDVQPWSKHSAAEWFFYKNKKKTVKEPADKNIYTSKYNLDSLIALRNAFEITHDSATAEAIRGLHKNKIIKSCKIYLASYKEEHFFRYYFLNKINLLRLFLMPNRLDDLPFPRFDSMSYFQKFIKGGYFIFLWFINCVGLIGCILGLIRGYRLSAFPLVLLSLIVFLFCYTEQRYLSPIYPFFVVFAAWLIEGAYTKANDYRGIFGCKKVIE
jgi:hypothetical protein